MGSIRALNTNLLVKWWWHLKIKKELLWSKMIKGIHNLLNTPHNYLSNTNINGVWKNIALVKNELKKQTIDIGEVFKLKIKSGDNSLFDKWLGQETLKEKFSDVYEQESRKKCMWQTRLLMEVL